MSNHSEAAQYPNTQTETLQTAPKTKVLLISHDIIGKIMAGPGIRYLQLARVLSQSVDLILAVRQQGDDVEPMAAARSQQAEFGLKIHQYRRDDWASIQAVAEWADVLIMPTDSANEFPQLAALDAALVIDGYDPLMAEWLALDQTPQIEQRLAGWQQRMSQLFDQYLVGDFYICASERQRLWWLGQLEVSGRLNSLNFQADPSLRQLVDVVPYGLPAEPPSHHQPMVKGIWPGIEKEDKLVLWGGGLWPWLDAISAIRAIEIVHRTRKDVKLIFPGTRHPNPDMAAMPTQNRQAMALAAELDLTDKAVFFGEWVPHQQWPDLLCECDVALSLHYDTVETELAFRSRVLDYIWAQLPTIATTGDATSELVAEHQLGIIVDYKAVDDVAAAIIQLLDEAPNSRSTAFHRAREVLTWEQAAAPLVRFCQRPRRAPDRPNHTGVPYYQTQLAAQAEQIRLLEEEKEHLETLVAGYERGKFIRLMRWLRS